MTGCVYGSCWEWVSSLPANQAPERVAQSNDSIVAGSGLVSRRYGVLGLPHGGKYNPSDIYQLAQATRKARERHSVVASSTTTELLTCDNDRATMLRSAYAAQRPDRQPASEGTTVSLDSTAYDPFGLLDDEEHYPSAEEFLIELGFGGPPLGIDRVPERFLCPSQMRGVQLDRFFAIEQEMDEARETSLGYRGLTGPAFRRPSLIVAKLVEKMMAKSGCPTAASSFECGPVLPPPVPPEEMMTTPQLGSQLMTLPLVESQGTTPASSRRSSLRRQECIDLDDLSEEPRVECQPSADGQGRKEELRGTDDDDIKSKGSHSEDQLPNDPPVPTVYVTPPQNANSTSSTDAPSSGHDVDSIIACLQLAAKAYRVQLDSPQSDENHNMADVLHELHYELDKTDKLLKNLKDHVMSVRSSHEPFSGDCLRSVLGDMIGLLQQQQRLYNQAADLAAGSGAPVAESDSEDDADSQVVQLPVNWVRGLERRVVLAVRRSVRRELLKATRSCVK